MSSPVAKAAIKFAVVTDTPWVLFADGDPAGVAAAEELVSEGGGDKSRLVWIQKADDSGSLVTCAFEAMMADFDPQMCWDACEDVRPNVDRQRSLLKTMKSLKGSVGSALARRLIEQYPSSADWPSALQTLLERLRQEI
ncbi:hypothetical protein A5654_15270 [Mycolicibacterium fortuitum]|nr:hypothetical protein A5654_15270 [Mycolicibacterium fortuitum]